MVMTLSACRLSGGVVEDESLANASASPEPVIEVAANKSSTVDTMAPSATVVFTLAPTSGTTSASGAVVVSGSGAEANASLSIFTDSNCSVSLGTVPVTLT